MKHRLFFKIFFIFCLQLLLVSCNKNDSKTNDLLLEGDKKRIEYSIEFPDTLLINQTYNGVIKYKSPLDTIITVFGDEKKNRYTRFILATTNSVDYDFNYLKRIVKDTFGALNNREIPFYDIKFKQTGTYYIDGIINDIVSIDTVKEPTKKDYLVRFIENEERVTHKVIVINKKPALRSILIKN